MRYSFAFWEDNGTYSGLAVQETGQESGESAAQSSSGAAYHTVTAGETLWELARRYGRTVPELVALNPQIKNPNLIRVGQEVRVR